MKIWTLIIAALLLTGCPFSGGNVQEVCAKAQGVVDMTCGLLVPIVPIFTGETGDFDGVTDPATIGKPGDCVTYEAKGKLPLVQCVPDMADDPTSGTHPSSPDPACTDGPPC
ncbi:MAG: hypothetical protein OEQ74_03310 [Gammaproteobacteria bacterium]|nr:hypothetical protein [Gammaproteobacteria bacterium]